MRTVSAAERRRGLVARHHLAGDLGGPEEVTRALLVLHATDPGSVHLSVLARSHGSAVADVGVAAYERRTLVRWLAMRRTLFVLATGDVPMVQAAVSTPLAAALRRRLVSRIVRNGTDPVLRGDPERWLTRLDRDVLAALDARGSATGAELAADVPALRTTLLPGAPSEVAQRLTSSYLAMLSATGRIVRGSPVGDWTSRHHRWEQVGRWWPDGVPAVADAEAQLARRWLERYGPATEADLQWWTGWTKTTTRRALAALDLDAVDLHGEPGVDLPREPEPEAPPVAALLPALDPTPMGWTRRDWFLPAERTPLFDRAGNVGPTVWWDGEVVGGWAVGAGGEVRVQLLADRGAEARRQVDAAAELLQRRLGGTVVTPYARTPLERELAR